MADENVQPKQELSYFDLTQKVGYSIDANLKNTEPQTAGNYGVIHIPRYGAEILYVSVAWGTASGTACTLQLEQLTGTTAPGSGNNIFLTAIDLTKTANTIWKAGYNVPGALTDFNRPAKYAQIKQGMRLGWKIASGATVTLKDLHMTVYFKYLNRGHFQ